MKVFYLIVLVLVAGAVTSYGRTGSEGTVFNKTQIHESMNNGTESSSKIVVPYDYLYLAMQWPGSYCHWIYCPQVPRHFTVHGLWPQNDPFDPPMFPPVIDCKAKRLCGRDIRFDHGQLQPRLRPGLNEYWPDLKAFVKGYHFFWEREYNRHGCCTFNNQNDFFYSSLEMVLKLGDLALKLSLNGPGPSIVPGNSYMYGDIRGAVHDVTSLWPRLVCDKRSRPPQLSEIRFCAKRINNVIVLVHCHSHSNCPNGLVNFP